jgi:hypothetical protein
LQRIPDTAWSLPSTYPNTDVHHGYRRVVLVSAGRLQPPHAELFAPVWERLAPVWDAWLSWIDPGGFIRPHRDGAPWRERWQVPIQPSGLWCGPVTFAPHPGEAFAVRHWEPHAVTNRGLRPRIHVVVDRDVFIEREPLPFTTFPIPADMADLIERSRQ